MQGLLLPRLWVDLMLTTATIVIVFDYLVGNFNARFALPWSCHERNGVLRCQTGNFEYNSPSFSALGVILIVSISVGLYLGPKLTCFLANKHIGIESLAR